MDSVFDTLRIERYRKHLDKTVYIGYTVPDPVYAIPWWAHPHTGRSYGILVDIDAQHALIGQGKKGDCAMIPLAWITSMESRDNSIYG